MTMSTSILRAIAATGATLAFAAGFTVQAFASEPLDTEFVDGGEITIQLSAGEHRITASRDSHIRVSWRLDDNYDDGDVDARTVINGAEARLELDGPRKNFRTVIEVPQNSNLIVRLSAGELDVEKVTGDKDIRLRAGDLSIEVGDAKDFAHVEGSLWAGDISAGPFNIEAEGLFRSIEYVGEGERTLRFHLYAGDVDLY